MGQLLNAHENLQKVAAEQVLAEKQAELLHKAAYMAEEMLANDGQGDYTEDDVFKVASEIVDMYIEANEEEAKIAEFVDKYAEFYTAGQVMARGYWEEYNANKPK